MIVSDVGSADLLAAAEEAERDSERDDFIRTHVPLLPPAEREAFEAKYGNGDCSTRSRDITVETIRTNRSRAMKRLRGWARHLRPIIAVWAPRIRTLVFGRPSTRRALASLALLVTFAGIAALLSLPDSLTTTGWARGERASGRPDARLDGEVVDAPAGEPDGGAVLTASGETEPSLSIVGIDDLRELIPPGTEQRPGHFATEFRTERSPVAGVCVNAVVARADRLGPWEAGRLVPIAISNVFGVANGRNPDLADDEAVLGYVWTAAGFASGGTAPRIPMPTSVVLKPTPGGSTLLSVRDGADGTLLSNVTMRYAPTEPPLWAGTCKSVAVDATGLVRFDDGDPASLRWDVELPGDRTPCANEVKLQIDTGSGRGELVVRRARRAHGTVRDHGRAASDTVILAATSKWGIVAVGETDAAGRFDVAVPRDTPETPTFLAESRGQYFPFVQPLVGLADIDIADLPAYTRSDGAWELATDAPIGIQLRVDPSPTESTLLVVRAVHAASQVVVETPLVVGPDAAEGAIEIPFHGRWAFSTREQDDLDVDPPTIESRFTTSGRLIAKVRAEAPSDANDVAIVRDETTEVADDGISRPETRTSEMRTTLSLPTPAWHATFRPSDPTATVAVDVRYDEPDSRFATAGAVPIPGEWRIWRKSPLPATVIAQAVPRVASRIPLRHEVAIEITGSDVPRDLVIVVDGTSPLYFARDVRSEHPEENLPGNPGTAAESLQPPIQSRRGNPAGLITHGKGLEALPDGIRIPLFIDPEHEQSVLIGANGYVTRRYRVKLRGDPDGPLTVTLQRVGG